MTLRQFTAAGFIALICCLLGLFMAGEWLSRPARSHAGPPPSGFTAVELSGTDDVSIGGWYAQGQRNSGAVLLLHGLRGDRTQMLGRASFLRDAGYSVLLIDLPSHGESSGDRITFGANEAEGVRLALDFLRRELRDESIGVIGVSLGAASTVLADAAIPPDAVILESMYPTIEEAVANRLTMRSGPMGALAGPALLWQLPIRAGIDAEDLRPIEHIASLRAPVLIISGSEDRHTTWQETLRLFAAASEPKELWQVEHAAHEDLHAFQPEQYRHKVLDFLQRYLRRKSAPP